MIDTAPQSLSPADMPFLQYLRYRLTRDSAGSLAWFAEKWRSSRLFKLGAFALGVLAAIWIAAWVWLASDLPVGVDDVSMIDTSFPTFQPDMARLGADFFEAG